MGTETDEETGWEFWERVYDDDKLRGEMETGWRGEPRLSEVLDSAALERTRLGLTGLPTSSAASQELTTLLEKELGPVALLRLTRTRSGKATLEFYYAEQAERARHLLDGREVLGVKLGVQTALSRFRPLPSLEERGLGPGERARAADPVRAEQGMGMYALVRMMEAWLKEEGPLRLSDHRLSALLKHRGSPSLQSHLAAWPQGAFRLRPEFRIMGCFLCLPGGRQEDAAAILVSLFGDAAAESPWKEPWEPFPMDDVRSLASLFTYMAGLLDKFGPLWIWDPRLLVVLDRCSEAAQLSREAFLAIAADFGLTLVADTLYNLRCLSHRTALAATTLQPTKEAAPSFPPAIKSLLFPDHNPIPLPTIPFALAAIPPPSFS